MDTETNSSAVSRRTVLRAAAWTAPVITVMSAAPAFAVSGGDIEGPDGDYAFRVPPGVTTVNASGKGLLTYNWSFKNSGIQPLTGVAFAFPTKGVKKWIPAAGLSVVRRARGRGRARAAKANTSGLFVHNGVVAPGQTIQFAVSAVPTKKWRKRKKLVRLANTNSSAIASANYAGSKPVLFTLGRVTGGRRRKKGNFSS
jgi:hypothetical protein